MAKYSVCCTETYTKSVIIEASSKEEAMEIVSGMVDTDEIDVSNNYDGHDVTVDYADLYED